MRLLAFGVLLGLLLFGCASPEAPEAAAPEPAEEPAAQPQEDEIEEDTGSKVTGEGTIVEVGESIPVTGDDESIISEGELSAHTTAASCWVLYEGKVYDVTGYLNKHPGGSVMITPHCGATGTEFTDAFEGKHGTSKVEILLTESTLVGNYGG